MTKRMHQEIRSAVVAQMRGSAVLPLLISTLGGLLFVMLFVNLSRYVGASNMVEQAARQVARCVSPTDPACVTYASTAPPADFKWYGNTTVTQNNIVIERYDYDATLYEQPWEVSYTTYLQHYVIPQLQYPANTVSVKTFETAPNQYEDIYARLMVTAQEITRIFNPKYLHNFPVFDNHDEWLNRNSSPDVWTPHYIDEHGDLQAFTAAPGQRIPVSIATATIPPGSEMRFESKKIDIPALNFQHSPMPPVCYETGTQIPCSAPDAVDPTKHTLQSWYAFAYVAIKPFMQVGPAVAGETTDVSWDHKSGDTNTNDGLWVKICPSADATDGQCTLRGLGGRVFSGEISETMWYGLKVRGPEGSNGAGVDPGKDQIGRHEGIAVPRGGYFTIIAYIRTKDNHGAAKVDLRFDVFYDDYNAKDIAGPEVAKQCGKKKYFRQEPPLDKVDGPEDLSECGFTGSAELVNAVFDNSFGSPLKKTPTCEKNSWSFPAEGSVQSQKQTEAVCDNSWVPTTIPQAPAGRLYCGWKPVPNTAYTITVGPLPTECSGQTNTYGTSDYPEQLRKLDKRYADPMQNPAVIAINNTIASLAQPPGAPVFRKITAQDVTFPEQEISVPANEQLHPAKPGRWDFSWESLGNSNYDELKTDVSLIKSYYQRVDDKWSPPKRDFDLVVTPGGKPIPQQFLSTDSFIKLQQKGLPDPEPITDRYPFQNKPEYKFSDLNPGETYADRFRDYIREVQPEYLALDQLYLEAKEPLYVDTVTLSPLKFAELKPRLHPDTDYKEVVDTVVIETVPINKGKAYSSANYPAGPLECTDGTYSECFSEVVVDDNLNDVMPEMDPDLRKAVDLGYQVVKKFDPQVQLATDCPQGQGHCFHIAIDRNTDPAIADVKVTYQLPLSFPLDVILGDTLPITHDKKEALELKMAGRDQG